MTPNTHPNVDNPTVRGFGEEWTKFDHSRVADVDVASIFARYFAIFPWAILDSRGAVGADFGCGSGRWAKFVAPKAAKLHLLDASEQALAVARQMLRSSTNVEFHHASIEAAPLVANSLDFAYSLGVLHHLPDTARAVRDIAGFLKPGAPFLLYLYYALDDRPFWFRALWSMSDILRRGISPLPFFLRQAICQTIAAFIYWPLSRTARVLEKLGRLPTNFPLAFYRNLPFYFLRNDALDRFGTKLEKRFSRAQIQAMLRDAGFENIQFSEEAPYWCSISYKKADA